MVALAEHLLYAKVQCSVVTSRHSWHMAEPHWFRPRGHSSVASVLSFCACAVVFISIKIVCHVLPVLRHIIVSPESIVKRESDCFVFYSGFSSLQIATVSSCFHSARKHTETLNAANAVNSFCAPMYNNDNASV